MSPADAKCGRSKARGHYEVFWSGLPVFLTWVVAVTSTLSVCLSSKVLSPTLKQRGFHGVLRSTPRFACVSAPGTHTLAPGLVGHNIECRRLRLPPQTLELPCLGASAKFEDVVGGCLVATWHLRLLILFQYPLNVLSYSGQTYEASPIIKYRYSQRLSFTNPVLLFLQSQAFLPRRQPRPTGRSPPRD